MRCSNCGTENRPGLRFCEQCGTPLAAEDEQALRTCSVCGTHSRDAARFCKQCGAPLEVAAPPEIEAAEPEPPLEQACSECGAYNRTTSRFCKQCGASLEIAAPPEIEAVEPEPQLVQTCPTCGAQNPATLRFCEQCGASLEIAAPPEIEAVEPEPQPVQTCPKCGAHSRDAARFCKQCGAPFVEVAPPAASKPAPTRSGRRPRWIVWAAAGAALTIIAVAAFFVLLYLRPTPEGEQAAIDVATLIVEEAFPEYAGAQRTVTKWDAGDGDDVYVVNYSIEADPAMGEPYPRGLNIYFDPETRQVSIEEMN
jgi:predicted amidophosphoribosyltransferase